jgi:hypothetical protein
MLVQVKMVVVWIVMTALATLFFLMAWLAIVRVMSRIVTTIHYFFFLFLPIFLNVFAKFAWRTVVSLYLPGFLVTAAAIPATDFPAFFAFFVKAPGLFIAP